MTLMIIKLLVRTKVFLQKSFLNLFRPGYFLGRGFLGPWGGGGFHSPS